MCKKEAYIREQMTEFEQSKIRQLYFDKLLSFKFLLNQYTKKKKFKK